MKQSVVIVQRRMTHYRLPLFNSLRQRLADLDITLRVLHGDPTETEKDKQDTGELPWAEHLGTRYLLGGNLCLQPFGKQVAGSDLVVVTQENKLVNNLPPLLGLGRPARLAFWGHGRNMQTANPESPLERFKRWTTRRVDWWFGYTQISADRVVADGFPIARVTVLNNSIDMASLTAQIAHARETPRQEMRKEFGLHGDVVGVFIGSLYPEKLLHRLLRAAQETHRAHPHFQCAVAGAGPMAAVVQAAAARSAGVKYLGAVHGERKARLLAASDLLLNPGLVGLGILDAFAAGIPILTSDCRLHSPEVAYLEPGRNGLMTMDSDDAFSAACQALVADAAQRAVLSRGAALSAETYSLLSMTDRFVAGIETCLAAPPAS